jgi:hypothetical protein
MTSCQAKTCTHELNSIHGSIYHKLWGDDVESRGGYGADVGDDEDGTVDVMKMLPPTPRRSRGCDGGNFSLGAAAVQPFWRWKMGTASAAPLENYGKNRASLFVKMNAYIRRWRQGNDRGPNRPWWRGQPYRPRRPRSFGPCSSPHVLPPLEMLLVVKY